MGISFSVRDDRDNDDLWCHCGFGTWLEWQFNLVGDDAFPPKDILPVLHPALTEDFSGITTYADIERAVPILKGLHAPENLNFMDDNDPRVYFGIRFIQFLDDFLESCAADSVIVTSY